MHRRKKITASIKMNLLGLNLRTRIGLIVVVCLALVGILGPAILGGNPAEMGLGTALATPSSAHPFGLDVYGRDQFARVCQGILLSLLVGLVASLGALVIGLPLGLTMAYMKGVVDAIASRLIDVLFAFPSLLLALFFVAILGPGVATALIALVVIYVPIVTRYVRNAALAEVSRDYVTAARVQGAGVVRICVHHLLPNIWPSLVVLTSSIFAFAVLAEAALSYLGVGARPPTASLGRILTENQGFLTTSPHLVLLPALVLSVLILAINIAGDGLRDHFSSGNGPRAAHEVGVPQV